MSCKYFCKFSFSHGCIIIKTTNLQSKYGEDKAVSKEFLCLLYHFLGAAHGCWLC